MGKADPWHVFVVCMFQSWKLKAIWLLIETIPCLGDIEGRLQQDVQAAMGDQEDSNNALSIYVNVILYRFIAFVNLIL